MPQRSLSILPAKVLNIFTYYSLKLRIEDLKYGMTCSEVENKIDFKCKSKSVWAIWNTELFGIAHLPFRKVRTERIEKMPSKEVLLNRFIYVDSGNMK